MKKVILSLNSVVTSFDGEYQKSLTDLIDITPEFVEDYVSDYNDDKMYHSIRMNEQDVMVVENDGNIYLQISGYDSNRLSEIITDCLASVMWSKFTATHAADEDYPISEDIFFTNVHNRITNDKIDIKG